MLRGGGRAAVALLRKPQTPNYRTADTHPSPPEGRELNMLFHIIYI